MTRKDIAAELIALAQLQAQRLHSGIMIQFVEPLVDGKEDLPDRKCNCKARPGWITFCYCLCGGDNGKPIRPWKIGGINAAEAA
jgi:hypothetical protein